MIGSNSFAVQGRTLSPAPRALAKAVLAVQPRGVAVSVAPKNTAINAGLAVYVEQADGASISKSGALKAAGNARKIARSSVKVATTSAKAAKAVGSLYEQLAQIDALKSTADAPPRH